MAHRGYGPLDADGFLTVRGRRDNLIVTPAGRNINPEWIETMLADDPRIGASVLCQIGDPAQLALLLIPSRFGAGWFQAASLQDIDSLVAKACQAAPDYARPKGAFVIAPEEAMRLGLFTREPASETGGGHENPAR